MKALNIIKYVFTIIGAGMLIGAFFLYTSTSTFLKTSITAEGEVIDLLTSRSSRSSSNSSYSGTSITYKPLVEFIDKEGKLYEFTTNSSSNPPSYAIGERVKVLYNPKSPHDAKIQGFFSLWGAALLVGGLGLVFFIIGGSMFIVSKRKKNLLKQLKLTGKRIDTDFQTVQINYSVAVNDRSPYQIVSQWQNPETSEIHIFTSDNIWFDPSDYIEETIKVLIDKRDPKKYVVDLSFLPKVAD